MRLLNKKQFAELAGVSRAAVGQACKAGALVIRPDGKLDIDTPVNKSYIEKHQAKARANKSKQSQSKTSSAAKQQPGISKEPQQIIEELLLPPENLGFDGLSRYLEALSRGSADKLKIIEQIRQLQVKTKKERRELISRDLVSKVYAKLYMIDVNEWRALGANLTPEIAACASIDNNEVMIKIEQVIEKEVFVILQHVKRTMNDFLKEIEAKELE